MAGAFVSTMTRQGGPGMLAPAWGIKCMGGARLRGDERARAAARREVAQLPACYARAFTHVS